MITRAKYGFDEGFQWPRRLLHICSTECVLARGRALLKNQRILEIGQLLIFFITARLSPQTFCIILYLNYLGCIETSKLAEIITALVRIQSLALIIFKVAVIVRVTESP